MIGHVNDYWIGNSYEIVTCWIVMHEILHINEVEDIASVSLFFGSHRHICEWLWNNCLRLNKEHQVIMIITRSHWRFDDVHSMRYFWRTCPNSLKSMWFWMWWTNRLLWHFFQNSNIQCSYWSAWFESSFKIFSFVRDFQYFWVSKVQTLMNLHAQFLNMAGIGRSMFCVSYDLCHVGSINTICMAGWLSSPCLSTMIPWTSSPFPLNVYSPNLLHPTLCSLSCCHLIDPKWGFIGKCFRW
jgi:hypothetical protein